MRLTIGGASSWSCHVKEVAPDPLKHGEAVKDFRQETHYQICILEGTLW